MTKRTISVFGSTGSVGKSTVKLLQHHADSVDVEVLTANNNAKLLAEQAIILSAKYAVIANEEKGDELKAFLKETSIKALSGRQALLEMAAHSVDWVMMAIVGMAGLEPIFKALPNGNSVAIANKEPLVSAGTLLMSRAKQYGATILPVDSEHNAIFQVFENDNRDAIERIILTASGGPFREWTKENIALATPEQAIAHPNWSMGTKISVDCATLMNKGLEVIEAHYLFGMPSERIDIVIHPQSIIHSMVQYNDGSVLAQMGAPDMSTPIVNALAYPNRMETCGQKLDIQQLSNLTFSQPDFKKFPALKIAYNALRAGGSAPLVLNASNEVAVAAFLNGDIPFKGIIDVVSSALEKDYKNPISTLEDILLLDQTVRSDTLAHIHKKSTTFKQTG